MPVPPNWVGLAAVGVLGLVNPGFWLVGAALEGAYLLSCVTSARFRAFVEARHRLRGNVDTEGKIQRIVAGLSANERQRFMDLDLRCRKVLGEVRASSTMGAAARAESLAAFRWAYLQLLVMRNSMRRVFEEAGDGEQSMPGILDRVEDLTRRLKHESLPEELRESLASQREVLQRRLQRHGEGHDRLEHIESELARIENHVELVREEALVSSTPDAAAARVDRAADTLEGTTKWIREQAGLNDTVAGLLADEPPMISEGN